MHIYLQRILFIIKSTNKTPGNIYQNLGYVIPCRDYVEQDEHSVFSSNLYYEIDDQNTVEILKILLHVLDKENCWKHA